MIDHCPLGFKKEPATGRCVRYLYPHFRLTETKKDPTPPTPVPPTPVPPTPVPPTPVPPKPKPEGHHRSSTLPMDPENIAQIMGAAMMAGGASATGGAAYGLANSGPVEGGAAEAEIELLTRGTTELNPTLTDPALQAETDALLGETTEVEGIELANLASSSGAVAEGSSAAADVALEVGGVEVAEGVGLMEGAEVLGGLAVAEEGLLGLEAASGGLATPLVIAGTAGIAVAAAGYEVYEHAEDVANVAEDAVNSVEDAGKAISKGASNAWHSVFG